MLSENNFKHFLANQTVPEHTSLENEITIIEGKNNRSMEMNQRIQAAHRAYYVNVQGSTQKSEFKRQQ